MVCRGWGTAGEALGPCRVGWLYARPLCVAGAEGASMPTVFAHMRRPGPTDALAVLAVNGRVRPQTIPLGPRTHTQTRSLWKAHANCFLPITLAFLRTIGTTALWFETSKWPIQRSAIHVRDENTWADLVPEVSRNECEMAGRMVIEDFCGQTPVALPQRAGHAAANPFDMRAREMLLRPSGLEAVVNVFVEIV